MQIILHLFLCSFFCAPKERTKEKAPEMTNSARSYARYTLPLRATDRAEFRTISGLPTHSSFKKITNNSMFFGFQTASENFQG
jgi:hypothetical protein